MQGDIELEYGGVIDTHGDRELVYDRDGDTQGDTQGSEDQSFEQ